MEVDLEHLWLDSDSPAEEETWSDDQEWPFDPKVSICRQEIHSSTGEKLYENTWKDWNRKDGSNTTWISRNRNPEMAAAIDNWDKKEAKRKKKMISSQEIMSVELWHRTGIQDLHNTHSIEESQAVDEKLKKANENYKTTSVMAMLFQKKLALEREHKDLLNGKAGQASAVSSSSSAALIGKTRRSGSTRTTTTHTSEDEEDIIPLTRSAKGKEKAPAVPAPKRRKLIHDPTPSRSWPEPATDVDTEIVPPKPGKSRKKQSAVISHLEKKWNQIISAKGAAPVKIINDQDDDETPPVGPSFEYVEQGYVYGVGMEPFEKGFLQPCECVKRGRAQSYCGRTSCSCRQDGKAVYNKGVFMFNVLEMGEQVVECNEMCSCDDSCPNRVAQCPRDIPLQIFKTSNRGWGVKTEMKIPKGKVIGLYTGLLMHREVAEALPARKQDYVFELSTQFVDEDDVELFSVNSIDHGNWSRFLNHSCRPNLELFLVAYDSIPEKNSPYIAFVASEEIKANTELTFNYHPGSTSRGSRKASARKCNCGAEGCSGWL